MDRSCNEPEYANWRHNNLEKADSFDNKIGYSSFNCSTGWLERFMFRHNIVFKKICGESGQVNSETTSEWTSTLLPALLSEFSPNDIHNTDETVLFYKCLTYKTCFQR